MENRNKVFYDFLEKKNNSTVNTLEAPEGYIAKGVIGLGYPDCYSCDFKTINGCTYTGNVPCYGPDREDKTDVVFKKIKG